MTSVLNTYKVTIKCRSVNCILCNYLLRTSQAKISVIIGALTNAIATLETTAVCNGLTTIAYCPRHNHIWFPHNPKSANFSSTLTGIIPNALYTLVKTFLFRRQAYEKELPPQDFTELRTNRKTCESVVHFRGSCVCFKLGYLPNWPVTTS